MRNVTTFTEARDEQDGNFALRVKDGYSRNGVAATEYTYNGLRWVLDTARVLLLVEPE